MFPPIPRHRRSRRSPGRVLMLAVLALLAACGGGGPEPEPEPLQFVQVHRFVEISGIQADGRHIEADTNNFIGPERHDEPGEYQASVEMGALPFILPGYDAIAEGEIYSSVTGKTFWVKSEAPKGTLGTPQNIGTRTRLELDQPADPQRPQRRDGRHGRRRHQRLVA